MSVQTIEKKIKEFLAPLNLPYYHISASKGYENILCFGERKGQKTTGDEKLFMFSMTKPITTFLAMRLIEQGKISLEDKVEKFLPFVKDCYLIENGNKKIVGDKILIKHLLTMSAGFDYDTESEYLTALYRENPNATTIEVIREICKKPLCFYPGESFNYSLCHDLLAGVIEVVEKEKFSAVANSVLFSPLNMTNSGFYTNGKMEDRYYFDHEKKVFIPQENKNDLVVFSNYESGGAGLVSSVNDYLEFAKMLANNGIDKKGQTFISNRTLDLWTFAQQKVLNIDRGFTSTQGLDYGYGYGVRTRTVNSDFGLPIGEFGWDGADGSYVLVDRVNNISVVIGLTTRNWPAFFIDHHIQIVKIIYENL